MELRKPLYEMSATEIIGRSLDLYLSRFMYFLAPFLALGIMNSILLWAMGYLMPPFNPPSGNTDELFKWLMGYLVATIGIAAIFFVISWVMSTLVTGITVKYSSDLLERGKADLRECVNHILSKVSSVLTAGLITGSLMILGFILFIVPGVIMTIMFSLVIPVIIIEDQGVFGSLRRSRKLVDKRWGKTFAVLIMVFIFIALASFIGDALGAYFDPLKGLVIMIVASLVQPLSSISLTYLYYSMRTREREVERPTPPQLTPAYSTPPSRPNLCSSCGEKLPSDAIFCPRCGRRIESL